MRLMIASDLHGSAAACRRLMNAWDMECPDRVLLLGDILYHGPRNDLPEEYNPREVIVMLNGRREAILCVRGNCDTEVDQMVLQFPILADYAWIAAGSLNIFATHGHVYHTKNLPPLRKGEILLHGHTHVPAWEDHGSFLYFNPGSAAIPKDGSAPSYMMLADGVFTWKTLEGKTYHSETPLR